MVRNPRIGQQPFRAVAQMIMAQELEVMRKVFTVPVICQDSWT